MNKNEFMAVLRGALSGLPDEERASALRYYEEYFDEAGPENEAQAAASLGDPQQIAQQILSDYRELVETPRPSAQDDAQGAPQGTAQPQQPPRRWRGVPVWLVVILAIFALPIGIPLLGGGLAILFGAVAAVFGILLGALVLLSTIPLALLVAGFVIFLFSFFLWGFPASAVATLGAGFVCMALGLLSGALSVKLCMLFVPPIVRGLVAVLRWPFDKLRNRGNAR